MGSRKPLHEIRHMIFSFWHNKHMPVVGHQNPFEDAEIKFADSFAHQISIRFIIFSAMIESPSIYSPVENV
jgi:hypothetical protein